MRREFTETARTVLAVGVWVLLAGCGGGEPAAPERPPAPAAVEMDEAAPTAESETSPATPAPPETEAPPIPRPTPSPAAPAPTPQPPAPPAPAPTEPETVAATEPVPPPPSPSTEAPTVVDPGGAVEVPAPKPGLTRIGAGKCKMCHKVQYASWVETAHGRREPPLDCEGCHGPGSEYKTMSVMKDPDKARSAGLVTPGKEFCATCHRADVSDELLSRAHAHKADG